MLKNKIVRIMVAIIFDMFVFFVATTSNENPTSGSGSSNSTTQSSTSANSTTANSTNANCTTANCRTANATTTSSGTNIFIIYTKMCYLL